MKKDVEDMLNDNKCPQCGDALHGDGRGYTICSSLLCSFVISNKEFNCIIIPQNESGFRPKYFDRTTENNLVELNNLGHDLVKEDFSGSIYL